MNNPLGDPSALNVDARISQILAQFDESAQNASFIDLDHGYYYTIDSRLHVYSDGNR